MSRPRGLDFLIPGKDSHPVYGKLAAVGIIDGERYYWFVDAGGCVSMMPADSVDQGEEK